MLVLGISAERKIYTRLHQDNISASLCLFLLYAEPGLRLKSPISTHHPWVLPPFPSSIFISQMNWLLGLRIPTEWLPNGQPHPVGNGLIGHRAVGQCAIPSSAVTTGERTRSTVVFGLFPDLPYFFLQSLSPFFFLFILFFIRKKRNHPGKVKALWHIPTLRTLVLCSGAKGAVEGSDYFGQSDLEWSLFPSVLTWCSPRCSRLSFRETGVPPRAAVLCWVLSRLWRCEDKLCQPDPGDRDANTTGLCGWHCYLRTRLGRWQTQECEP